MNIREIWTTCSQLQPHDCESTIVRLHWLRRVWQQARTRAAFADNRNLSSRNDLRVVFCAGCGRPPRVGLFVEHLDQDPVVFEDFRLVGALGFCAAPNLNGFGKLGSLVWRDPGYFWVLWQKWTMILSVAEVAAKWPSRIQECSRWFLEMGLYTQWQSDWLNWWLMTFDDWCCWFHWGVPSIQRWNFLQNFLQYSSEHVRNFKSLLTTADMCKDKPGKWRPGRKYVACMDKARQIETTENHANISKHSLQNLLVKATCLDVQKPSTSLGICILWFSIFRAGQWKALW